jgi:phospholipid transport system transporter-binding protein
MSHTIALAPVLTADTVVVAQTQLLHSMQAQPQGAHIVLDASGVQSFDSAGLALLLACLRAAHARQQSLRVQGWTGSLQSLAQVYGVMPLLDTAVAPQAA